MNAPEHEAYRFGPFLLDPRERQLLRDGVTVQLPAKAFDLLRALVRNHGRLVTKEALLAEVWPGVVVEEVNLTVNISALRKVLAAGGGEDWIETVPRHGYRFRAAVLPGAALPAIPASPSRRRYVALAASALGAVALGSALWWFGARTPPVRFDSLAVLPFVAESKGDEEIADGLTEETINRLTAATALRIAPRASAFRFKGSGADAIAVGPGAWAW